MARLNRTNSVKLGLATSLGVLVVVALASASLVFAQMGDNTNDTGNYGVSLTCDTSLATSEIELLTVTEPTEEERLAVVNRTLELIDLDALPSNFEVDEFKALLYEQSIPIDVPYTPRRSRDTSTRSSSVVVETLSFSVVEGEEFSYSVSESGDFSFTVIVPSRSELERSTPPPVEPTEEERLEVVRKTLELIDLDALPSNFEVDEFKALLYEQSVPIDVPYTPRRSYGGDARAVELFHYTAPYEITSIVELHIGKDGLYRVVDGVTTTIRASVHYGEYTDSDEYEAYGLPNLPDPIRRAFDCVRTLDDDDRRALAEVLIGQDYYPIVAMQLGVSEEEVRNALNGLADDLRSTTYDYSASELSRNLAEVAADLGVTRITLLGALSESVLLLGESRKDAGELETLKLTFARLGATGLISSDDVDAINQWLDEWVAGIPESQLADGIRGGFGLGFDDIGDALGGSGGFDLFRLLGLGAYYDEDDND